MAQYKKYHIILLLQKNIIFTMAASMILSLCLGCTPNKKDIHVSNLSAAEGRVGPDELNQSRDVAFLPTHQFCSPDRVAVFRKIDPMAIDFSGPLAKNTALKLTFDPEELKKGVIKCSIKDCTITVLKPIAVQPTLPLALATIAMVFTLEGQKQVGENPEKKITTSVDVNPIDIGIAQVGVFLASEYSHWRTQNPGDEQVEKLTMERIFGCTVGIRCNLPTITLEIGAKKTGLYFLVNGNTAKGTKLQYGSVSTDYYKSEGHIRYLDIPRATTKGIYNLYRFIRGEPSILAQGEHVDPEWDEIIAQCQAHSRRQGDCGEAR